MSTQNNSTDKTDQDWIPHSKVVESITKKGESLNTHIQLSSRDEKAKYLAEMSDRFQKEWKQSGNR